MVKVKMRQAAKSRCEGCKWLERPRGMDANLAEPHYKNPKSTWYLQTTACRCARKEWQ